MMRRSLITISATFLLAASAFAQGGSTTTGTTAATTSATPAPAKPAVFRPTKDQIKQGQTILIEKKLYTGQATGVYGDSRPAIKAYQKANGLEENGKFDPPTLAKMGIALTDSQKGIVKTASSASTAKTSSTTSTTAALTQSSTPGASSNDGPKRPAPFQANKEQITALQKKLIDGKMFTGEANGERSDALKDAIKKYQAANGLNSTGGINAATLTKMGIALTDPQKAQVAAQAAYDAANKKN